MPDSAAVYPEWQQQDEPGAAEDARAGEHRRQALTRLDAGDTLGALAHGVLALEARVEELTVHIAMR